MPHLCNNLEHEHKEKIVNTIIFSKGEKVGSRHTVIVYCPECGDPEPQDEEEILDAHLKQQKPLKCERKENGWQR